MNPFYNFMSVKFVLENLLCFLNKYNQEFYFVNENELDILRTTHSKIYEDYSKITYDHESTSNNELVTELYNFVVIFTNTIIHKLESNEYNMKQLRRITYEFTHLKSTSRKILTDALLAFIKYKMSNNKTLPMQQMAYKKSRI
jgi:hypothetical protein